MMHMAHCFLDSSALVKRYIDEAGTRRVLEIIESSDRLIVSSLARVEITAALVRRARRGGLSEDHLHDILAALETELREVFEVMELSAAIMTRATDLVRTHALRAADAIQLASALVAMGGPSKASDFTFVSADAELNAAARQEGLNVADPCAE
jgi:hypothetical protein